jgi:hypothetical protein
MHNYGNIKIVKEEIYRKEGVSYGMKRGGLMVAVSLGLFLSFAFLASADTTEPITL